MSTNKCSKCGMDKSPEEFYVHRTKCKQCVLDECKIYRENNKEKIRNRLAKKNKGNKERVAQKQLEYRNRPGHDDTFNAYYRTEEQKQKRRNRYKIRAKTDIQYKIKKNLRTRIYLALSGINKSGSMSEFLGIDIDGFKIYLECMFYEGMTWGNYGEWHIDHKIPCSFYDLSDVDNQKKCFHYTNLQPLWAKDNLSKGDKIVYPTTEGVL